MYSLYNVHSEYILMEVCRMYTPLLEFSLIYISYKVLQLTCIYLTVLYIYTQPAVSICRTGRFLWVGEWVAGCIHFFYSRNFPVHPRTSHRQTEGFSSDSEHAFTTTVVNKRPYRDPTAHIFNGLMFSMVLINVTTYICLFTLTDNYIYFYQIR